MLFKVPDLLRSEKAGLPRVPQLIKFWEKSCITYDHRRSTRNRRLPPHLKTSSSLARLPSRFFWPYSKWIGTRDQSPIGVIIPSSGGMFSYFPPSKLGRSPKLGGSPENSGPFCLGINLQKPVYVLPFESFFVEQATSLFARERVTVEVVERSSAFHFLNSLSHVRSMLCRVRSKAFLYKLSISGYCALQTGLFLE